MRFIGVAIIISFYVLEVSEFFGLSSYSLTLPAFYLSFSS